MGIIICQSCNKTIDVFEGEKVTTLYAKGNGCEHCKSTEQNNNK
ncbi:GapA-binding peptide SR1P [Halalkalibacter kiskunsagensis]|uniref:GapA-binding peptide SR1P n=1 Tax=Halalkalibacter kiskunsagensis TaxID=1548599 RepID=A0ABV6KBE0_9BACI